MRIIRGMIAGFFIATGRGIPDADYLEPAVEMAMIDWARIPAGDLPEVCARARLLATGKNGNWPATTTEVMQAWRSISSEYHRTAYQRIQKEREALIESGTALAEPTITEISDQGREDFFDELYASAGLRRHKVTPN